MSKSIREQLIELGLAKPPAVKPTNTAAPAQRAEKGLAYPVDSQKLGAATTGRVWSLVKATTYSVLGKQPDRHGKGYLDEQGNALCPICSQRIPYSQLDGHISDVHGNHLLSYYGNWDRGGDVRAKIVSGGGPGTGKRR